MPRSDPDRRDVLKAAGLFAAGSALWPAALAPAAAGDPPPADPAAGRRELVAGLDGMSRAADAGNDPFVTGHTAAAVMASAFFCREQALDADTRKELLAVVEARLLGHPAYGPRPADKADPALLDGLVKDLDAGIDTLRRSGHNIIFAAVALKALRAVPGAATADRVGGLRKTVLSFGTGRGKRPPRTNPAGFADLGDESKFVRFVFEEYLTAIELYRTGKGHHGFAGHVLTAGHALLELHRMGYKETAAKGLEAFWQFVGQARAGADLGGKRVETPGRPAPVTRDYWLDQGKRTPGRIVSSHLVKYPYSFYALAKDLRDEPLKQRVLDSIPLLTAIS